MNEILRTYALPAALGLVGLAATYLMFRLLFLPARAIGAAVRASKAPSTDERLPRPREALALTTGAAAAGALGGTATAIVLGGPGAVFWVMLGGFLSMALRYVEASLAWQTRQLTGERMSAGVGAGLRSLSSKAGGPLAHLYVLLAIVAAAVAFGALGTRELGLDLERSLKLPALAASVVLALSALALTWRSARLPARLAQAITPIALGLLCVLLVATCLRNGGRIPGALGRIFAQALEGGVASAGFLGAFLVETIRTGIARGLFSGSSLGVAASIHGASGASSSHRAGLVASLEPLLAGILLPLLVGTAVLTSRSWNSPHDTRIPLNEVRAFNTEPASAAELQGSEIAIDGIIRVRDGQSYDRFTLATATELINEPRFEYAGAPWDGAIRFARGNVEGLLELRGAHKALEDVDLGKAEKILVTGEGPIFGTELVGTSLETLLPFRWGRWVTGAAALALALVAALALLLFADGQASGLWGSVAGVGARILVAAGIALGPLAPVSVTRQLPWVLVPLAIVYVVGLVAHGSRAEADEDEPIESPSRRKHGRS